MAEACPTRGRATWSLPLYRRPSIEGYPYKPTSVPYRGTTLSDTPDYPCPDSQMANRCRTNVRFPLLCYVPALGTVSVALDSSQGVLSSFPDRDARGRGTGRTGGRSVRDTRAVEHPLVTPARRDARRSSKRTASRCFRPRRTGRTIAARRPTRGDRATRIRGGQARSSPRVRRDMSGAQTCPRGQITNRLPCTI